MAASWRELVGLIRSLVGSDRTGRHTKKKHRKPGVDVWRQRVLAEAIEPRLMLAATVLPAADAASRLDILDAATANWIVGPLTTPSIAQDPTNPRHLVAVAATVTTLAHANQIVRSVSNDNGDTWSAPVTVPFMAMPNGGDAMLTETSVAFDGLGNYYVSFREHSAANDAGAIMIDSFPAAGGGVSQSLYTWVGQDPAYMPYVAADGNLAQFTDPDVKAAVQTDGLIGAGGQGIVYVAFSILHVDPVTLGRGRDHEQQRRSGDGLFRRRRYVLDVGSIQ